MKIYVINVLLISLLADEAALSESDIHVGYQVTLAIPSAYTRGFVGRAFVMETEQTAPKFRAAISVEAVEEKYSCSLDIFLGDVRVWSSGHLSSFYTTDICVLQFTQHGDLRLKGPTESVGWRSGTSGQGVKLTSNGLEIFNGDHRFDQIKSTTGLEPVRFLKLDSSTGNLRLYHYSDDNEKFEPSYHALNHTCDLPLACQSYGICTSSGSCSCIRLTNEEGFQSNCSTKNYEGLCGKSRTEMLELRGVVSVLKSVRYKANVGKEECSNWCLDDCTCVAVQHAKDEENTSSGECSLYRMARGIKQVERGSKVSYMVKVPKGTINHGQGRRSGLKKWVIIVIGVVDGFVILVVLVGIGYYVVRKRRKNLDITGQAN